MKTDHPPVPPGCPYFKKYMEYVGMAFFIPESGKCILLTDPDIDRPGMVDAGIRWRFIIAAVAARWWEKLHEERFSGGDITKESSKYPDGYSSIDCINNCYEWQKWGEQQ